MKKWSLGWSFYVGAGALLLLAILYFIQIPVESGGNYVQWDNILYIIVFHNPYVLAIYILVGVMLAVHGARKK